MACEEHGPDCNPEWEEHWTKFKFAMESRFKTGHETYGDNPGTFSRTGEELICEIIEEAEDIIGWGFALRVRLLRMLEATRGLYPERRANELLQSARGQSDKLIRENIRLREEVARLEVIREKTDRNVILNSEDTPNEGGEPSDEL
jgi:hypothetical protein